MHTLSIISSAIWILGISFTAAGTFFAFLFFRDTNQQTPGGTSSEMGISVLKPLKGVDFDTKRCLESFFWQEYPRFELLFCVADPDDLAVALVRKLMRQYPDVNARLFIENVEIGPNPKINNMLSGYREARFDSILISDSNICVAPSYLSEMASQFEGQDMISSVVSGEHARNFTAGMEEVFLGGFYARPMVLSWYLGRPCMMGKSMLFRRAAMEKLGGLASLAPYLAEDFMAGEKFRLAGYKVSLSRFPVTQIVGAPRFRVFWSRHLRWGRIRKTHALAAFLAEPFFGNAFVSGAFGTLAAFKLWGVPAPAFLALHFSTWLLLDALSMWSVGEKIRWSLPLTWTAREALHIPLWIHIASGNSIQWKGRSWRLDDDGSLTEADNSSPATETEGENEGIAASTAAGNHGASAPIPRRLL